MTAYKIKEILDPQGMNDFIKVPFIIYREDPYWVPLLKSDLRRFFDRNVNPFFRHSSARFFVAYKNNQPIARIAGIINNRHNEFHGEKTGFFGFFECPDDHGLAAELFDAAAETAINAGMQTLRGPANYSSNDDWGFLLEGFDQMPVFQMPYNPSYYLKLAESCGFAKCKDLFAYYIDHLTPLPENSLRLEKIIKRRSRILVRSIDMKHFDRELEYVRQIYNAAWSKNWGFVPMTEEEIEHVAADFIKVVDPSIVFLAFVDDEPAGFSLTMPNLNPVLKRMNGRLFPLGLAKFLWHTKIKRSVDSVRIMATGVVHKFQKIGIDNIFYVETYRVGRSRGYKWGELSWILEDNHLINRALTDLGARLYKRYRLYEKPLRSG